MLPRHAEEIAARRAARLARLKRRQPYRLKPDLAGMTKRKRRFGYWRRWCGTARLQRATLIADGAVKPRPRRRKPEPKRRELLPRPKVQQTDKRLYCRRAEHGRETYGREGIGLLRLFSWLF